MKVHLVLILLLILEFSSACVDINSASLGELDRLDGIGPVYAERIIGGRPYDEVDDLIEVNGIGEKTLGGIKEQGLACVDDEDKEEAERDEEIVEVEETKVIEKEKGEIVLNEGVEVIALNGEEILENKVVYESKDAKVLKYLPYAFCVFLIVIIGFLLWER